MDIGEVQNLVFLCQGGLGDQLCAEPVVRYARNRFPGSNVFVVSEERDFFFHLGVRAFGYGNMLELPGNETVMVFKTFSAEQSGFGCNLFHPVDFASMSALKRQLPLDDRSIRLDAFGGPELVNREDVIVHPGLTWPTRTFPYSWWQEVVDRIARDRRVVLVGTSARTIRLECPSGCVDLRDCSMRRFIAEMSSDCTIVTNDSLPVHVAGAFDNWICLIPTCKHPDLVLPYRNGTTRHRVSCLFKELMSERLENDFDTVPKGSHIMDYLPDPSEVVEEACLRADS